VTGSRDASAIDALRRDNTDLLFFDTLQEGSCHYYSEGGATSSELAVWGD
jgi:hypothetical protein